MASLLGLLGAIGDTTGIGSADEPSYLTRLNRAADPTGFAQLQIAQNQGTTGQLQNQVTQSDLAKLAELRNQGQTNPQQMFGALASIDPAYTERAATLQAQNPLASFGQPIPSNGQQGSTSPQIYSPESPDDKRNYNFLSTLPAPIQGLVKGLSDGDESSGTQAFKSPMSLALQAYAKQFDPSFSQTAFTQRNATSKDFASGGKSGQAITSINTGTKHLAQVVLAGLALPNQKSDTWLGRKITNSIGSFLGQDATTNFNSTVNTVAPELAKAAASGGDTDVASREAQKEDFSSSNSPEQILGAAAGKVQLLQGKGDEIGNTHKTIMGHSKQIISPENVQTQKDIVALHELAKSGKLYSTTEGFGNHFSEAAQPIIARLKVASSDTSAPSQGSAPSQAAPSNAAPSKPPLDKATALAIAKQRGLIK